MTDSRLRLDPEPLAAVEQLYSRADSGDRVAGRLADRVDSWFDELESRPLPLATRARYLRPPGLWMITIGMSGDQDDWAILWDGPDDEDRVFVRYLGSASFA